MLGKTEQNPAAPGFELLDLMAQEELYTFDSFTQSDALRLGKLMLAVSEEYGLTSGVEIVLNDMTVFKQMPEAFALPSTLTPNFKVD